MAEERDLATVRATETTDTQEVSKEELQRRLEEARESITHTVAEIKDTVTNQYQAVKESVTEALDWREQYRKRPVAFSIGALSVGFIVGYALAGAFTGDGEGDYRSYEQDETQGLRSAAASIAPAAHYYGREGSEGAQPSASHSYAAHPITGSSAFGSSGSDTASLQESAPAATSPGPYQAMQQSTELDASAAEEEAKGPGLIKRFKGTKAYDRLEEEVSSLGDRLLNELSKTAQSVVLPLLFNKVKDLFGVDLSNKEGEGRASQQRQGSSGASASGPAQANASLSGAAQSSFAGVNRGTTGGSQDESTQGGLGTASTGNRAAAGGSSQTGGGTGSSYATSENRGFGAAIGDSSSGSTRSGGGGVS